MCPEKFIPLFANSLGCADSKTCFEDQAYLIARRIRTWMASKAGDANSATATGEKECLDVLTDLRSAKAPVEAEKEC
jgi:hypothetical protein